MYFEVIGAFCGRPNWQCRIVVLLGAWSRTLTARVLSISCIPEDWQRTASFVKSSLRVVVKRSSWANLRSEKPRKGLQIRPFKRVFKESNWFGEALLSRCAISFGFNRYTLSRLTSSMVLKPLKIMNDGEIVKEGHLRRLKVKKNDFQIFQNDAVWLLQAAIQTSLTPTLN